MGNLYRLVYTSYRKPSCTDEEIKKILDSCKRNNPDSNITGVLIHAERRFIQYLEGGESDLLNLFDLIKEDNRHTSVNRRNFEPISSRVFAGWEMGYTDISKNIGFHTAISESDRKYFESLINGELDFGNEGMKILQLFFQTT